jgi:hypothetical protein
MPLGINRVGSYRKGTKINVPHEFGHAIEMPHEFGHVIDAGRLQREYDRLCGMGWICRPQGVAVTCGVGIVTAVGINLPRRWYSRAWDRVSAAMAKEII